MPKHVFVAYYPEGPHAGPITIGLFGIQDGALLPVFSSREKAIDFAVRTLGSPPHTNESWDGVELPAPDLIRFLLGDASIRYVAVNPPPSGEVELVPTPEFVEELKLEAGDAAQSREDFSRSLVHSLVYGDVN
ncbi:MAG: hypothetical protein LC714_05305 [Actinobacteria bacterium]|nr:hypothetical protein [Actinomycetota bacterium]